MSTMFLRISLHKKGLQIVAKGCRRVGLLCELMGQSERVQQTGPDSIEQSADHRWKIVLCLRPVSWGYPLYMCFWVQSGGPVGHPTQLPISHMPPTCPAVCWLLSVPGPTSTRPAAAPTGEWSTTPMSFWIPGDNKVRSCYHLIIAGQMDVNSKHIPGLCSLSLISNTNQKPLDLN